MSTDIASSITKAASKQTYYTILFLVDRDRVQDAYRAYGYFRWVDDVLDSDVGTPPERMAFLERQKALLESCYRGEPPRDVDLQESMLVELIQHDHDKNSGLQAYLRNMMAVMDFDARRRGRVISQMELNKYTRWLAIAVTEAMDYFIGNGAFTPHDETRYLAVTAAHIIHMLRDTSVDVQSGYFNAPLEMLDANMIGPQDIQTQNYRRWVEGRVELARTYFTAGWAYFRRVQNWRHRLAGFAYMARFEWLLETIEREGYFLRPEYHERKTLATGLKMSWLAIVPMIGLGSSKALAGRMTSPRQGKA